MRAENGSTPARITDTRTTADPRTDPARPPPRIDPRPGEPAMGALVLAIRPWCDAFVDGRAVGRSPRSKPIPVRSGTRRVVCRQGKGGPSYSTSVNVPAGRTVQVVGSVLGSVRVSVRLSSAELSVTIDGTPYRRGTHRLPPGRHRVVLLKNGVPQTTRWISIPPGKSCTLRDRPNLDCR